jgi:uncharacterized protein (TIGR01777 family)
MIKNILITGGTGLLGKDLSDYLSKNNYSIAVLSRNPHKSKVKSFFWDYKKNEIDPEAIEFADAIIHLAGENISNKRWSPEQKKEIMDSRVKTTNLLFDSVKTKKKDLKKFVSVSAIGFYGTFSSDSILTENSPQGNDFLAHVVKKWEDSVLQFETLNIPTVILRSGVVLSKDAGALPKMIKTINLGLGSAIGSGKQYMPWIHINDLVQLFYFTILNNSISGIFNAVASEHVTNKTMMKTLAKINHKPFFLPNIPSFIMRIFFGEMSVILTEGSRISSDKIKDLGYNFSYPDLNSALRNLLQK